MHARPCVLRRVLYRVLRSVLRRVLYRVLCGRSIGTGYGLPGLIGPIR